MIERADVERSYADRVAVVTGASGFLGAHLVARLVPLCKRVVAFARGSATPALAALAGADIVLGDVRNFEEVARAVSGADVLFHLAARSGAQASQDDPMEDALVNCGGLLNVLEAARRQPRPVRIVFPGSRLQYGRAQRVPVPETAPLAPLVPYGLHKTFCEQYLDLYARRFGLGYAVARITNPYGFAPHSARRTYNVLNQLIERALGGAPIPVYGTGDQLRDYIFVDDVSEAFLLLGARSDDIVANVGSGTGTALVDVVKKIIGYAGSGSIEFVAWPPEALAIETGDFVADVTRMRALGWRPRWSLEDGLRSIVAAQGAATRAPQR